MATVLTGFSPLVTPMMELKPNAGSDRAWVWNTHADFADECPKPELLAIRFLNAESKQNLPHWVDCWAADVSPEHAEPLKF